MNPTADSPLEGYLSTTQIASEYGVTSDHVRLLIRSGKVKAIRPGREYWIARAEWERYEQEKESRGAKRGPRARTRQVKARKSQP